MSVRSASRHHRRRRYGSPPAHRPLAPALPAGSVWQATGSLPQGVVDRPAGNYVASAATEVEKTLSFSLAAGETKYVRSYVGFGVVAGRVNLELEPAEKARAELADLSYTGSPTAGK